jgi:hypothetical protein
MAGREVREKGAATHPSWGVGNQRIFGGGDVSQDLGVGEVTGSTGQCGEGGRWALWEYGGIWCNGGLRWVGQSCEKKLMSWGGPEGQTLGHRSTGTQWLMC